MKFNLTIIVVVFTLLIGCKNETNQSTDSSKSVESVSIKDPKIITAFEELDEQYFHSNDTLLVINFWATWCKPCVQELPYFNSVADQFKGQKVKFVFVSLDFMNTIEKSVKPFLRKNTFKGEVVILADQDVNNWAINIDKNWDGAIPVTLLINQDKKTTRLGSFKDAEDLKTFIQSNL